MIKNRDLAAVGVALALAGSRGVVQLISTRTSVVTLDLAIDWRVLAFTALVGIFTGLLFGVVPALRATTVTPAATLRDHARGVLSGGALFLTETDGIGAFAVVGTISCTGR